MKDWAPDRHFPTFILLRPLNSVRRVKLELATQLLNIRGRITLSKRPYRSPVTRHVVETSVRRSKVRRQSSPNSRL